MRGADPPFQVSPDVLASGAVEAVAVAAAAAAPPMRRMLRAKAATGFDAAFEAHDAPAGDDLAKYANIFNTAASASVLPAVAGSTSVNMAQLMTRGK